jgi:hypothetical protein
VKRCRHCGTEQPDEAFGICLIRGEKVYRRQQCQKCKQARATERKVALRGWLHDYKKTLHCVKCGFDDFRALTFHHEDHREKDFNVSDMVSRGHSVASIQQEITKCVVLCANCHHLAHAEKWLAAVPVPILHTASPTTPLIGTRKVCRYCLVEQDESFFEVCKVIGERVYRRHKCRDCKRATQHRRRLRLRDWLDTLKQTLQCADCGFNDYRAIEFHHPDSQEKDFAIGEMIKDNRSIAAVEREIAKCVALCANCHRIEHFDEQEWDVVSTHQFAPVETDKEEQCPVSGCCKSTTSPSSSPTLSGAGRSTATSSA